METAAPEFSPDVPSQSPNRQHRKDWINRFVDEWQTLANGRIDMEYATMDAITLQRVVGHRLPEEVARQHFNSCTGADSPLKRAEEKFQSLAVEVGLLDAGQPLSKEALDFAYGVATLCAGAADRFRDARDGCAGDHIRAMYGPVPF